MESVVQPGVHAGELPPGVAYGRATLRVAYASFDTTDDPDLLPEQRIPSAAALYLSPMLTGTLLVNNTVVGATPTVLRTKNGVFDFWAVDGKNSLVTPRGWLWRATLKVEGKLWGSFTFSPDSTTETPLDLAPLMVLSTVANETPQVTLQMLLAQMEQKTSGPPGRGVESILLSADGKHFNITYTDNTTSNIPAPQAKDGRTPTLGWQGTRITVDGVAGPDLAGPPGVPPVVGMSGDQITVDGVVTGPHLSSSLKIGSVTSGPASAQITGKSPDQVLDLVLPRGEDGDSGPPNKLSIGAVTSGVAASANIRGDAPAQTLDLVLPQGPAGPKGDSAVLASTVEIRGTGSPYGVVTPPSPGTYYTDTAGTNGAWRWLATGTSTNSWVVVYGDTGRRKVSASVVGLSSGNVYIRRVNNSVTVDADDAQWGNLTSGNPAIPLTSGFVPSPTYVGGMFALNGAGTNGASIGLSRIDKAGAGLRFSDAGKSLWLRDTRTWSTLDPWPSTLPGTPD